jgi:hypothetical protein
MKANRVVLEPHGPCGSFGYSGAPITRDRGGGAAGVATVERVSRCQGRTRNRPYLHGIEGDEREPGTKRTARAMRFFCVFGVPSRATHGRKEVVMGQGEREGERISIAWEASAARRTGGGFNALAPRPLTYLPYSRAGTSASPSGPSGWAANTSPTCRKPSGTPTPRAAGRPPG